MVDVGVAADGGATVLAPSKGNIFSGPALWYDLGVISDSPSSTSKDPPSLPEIRRPLRILLINSFYGKIHPS